MIVAEILTAPRSLDAPAAAQAAAVTAARPAAGAGFADVLAQSVTAAVQTSPVAEGAVDVVSLPLTPAALAPMGVTASIAAGATETPAMSARLALAMGTVAPASVTVPSVPQMDVPAPGLATAGAETGPLVQGAPMVVARLAVAAPDLAASPDLPSPDAAPTPATLPTAAPQDPEPTVTEGALAPQTVEPAPPGQVAPAAQTPEPATPDPVTPEPVTADPETADTTQTDAAPPHPTPTPAETATDANADADAQPPTDDAGDGEADTTDAQTEQPLPQATVQPVTLPPLAALIQPLIAPPSTAKGDTEATAPGEVSGSTPRKSGMSGRLALLAGADTPATDTDSTARFADRLTPAPGQTPQDSLPAPRDGGQDPTAPRDTALTDAAEDMGGAAPATAQPLPADTRMTATPAPAPQRLPESGPLDTTQSGWEAALTERITARDTDLGQEIEISLSPENLGHIRIKLDLTDKAATVQIVTDTPQAAQLFQQSEARLAEALNRAGLSLTSHDASSRDPGGREGGQGGQRQGQTPGNPRAEAALAGLRGTLSAPAQTGRAANLVNIVA